MNRNKLVATASALALLCPMAASAQDTVNILVGNFDLAFDGTTGQVTDEADPAGGNLDSAEAFGVSSMELEVNGVSDAFVTDPPTDIYVDLLLTNLGSLLTSGAYTTGAGGTGDTSAFGLDLFGDGFQLRLGIDDISYIVVPTGIPGANLFQFSAEAKVLSQNLPNGRLLGEDVLISYTATDAALDATPNGVSSLSSSGQLTITGELVPEPSSMALLVLAGSTLLRRRRGA